ncbi:hypothetical protein CDD82_3748 [Ophiocordyceps australis]|uniref:Uncharacterized protein n=1 Tax=Ophiocordyceps australis TaxID=1399860 RepID=A0A2C5Z524_9HYPO|nr:hypothetical protein CDD82_3748 [Ophiocordyceps australis]
MAPRGPRSSASTRQAKSTTKASTRAGITKHRGPTRADIDGDIDMDAPTRASNRSTADGAGNRRVSALQASRNTRALPRNPRREIIATLASRVTDPSQLRAKPGFAVLRVHGLSQSKAASNPDGGLEDLIAFLKRKASSFVNGPSRRHIGIQKCHRAGDYVYITASKRDAEELVKINKFQFAGTALEVVAMNQDAVTEPPCPIPQHGPDFRDLNGVGESFLLDFFAMFDSDRQGLISRFYDKDSTFSLAVDTQSIRDTNAPAPLPWSAYLKFSRNLLRITHRNARIQRLFKGANVIYELWANLPLTRHPDVKSSFDKYIFDCHPVDGLANPNGPPHSNVSGLTVSAHGEFDESDTQTHSGGKRSFSRTFVLGPGQNGQGAIRVVSDVLMLRAYNALPDVSAAPTANAVTNGNQHDAMIVELSKQTGMLPEYSKMCLEQVDWQFEKALPLFLEKKGQLPADAFA